MKQSKAFTLIELLVVMAIIAILAGVVMVSMTNYRARALQTAALQTASSVMPAAMKCALEIKPITWDGSADYTALGHNLAGKSICAGSSFTWPTLDTPSTQGWTYVYAGDVSGQSFYALCQSANCGGSGSKMIYCAVTYPTWPAPPGTCKIVDI